MDKVEDEFRMFEEIIEFFNKFSRANDIKGLYILFQRCKLNLSSVEQCNTLTDFVRLLTTEAVTKFGLQSDNRYFSADKLLTLTVLDEGYNLREEWKNFLLDFRQGGGYIEKRFQNLMRLCSNVAKSGGNGQAMYNLFRMDYLIVKPIANFYDFEADVYGVLKHLGNNFIGDFRKLFWDFYEKNNFEKEYYICSNCKYKVTEDIKHIFCKNAKIEKIELKSGEYIIKEDVYKDYTLRGIVEKDMYNALIENGFEAYLYPSLEKEGDIKVVIYNKVYFLDGKSYTQTAKLVKDLKEEKYNNRIIVVPDLNYKDQKEYIIQLQKDGELYFDGEARVFNVTDLIKYFKLERQYIENEVAVEVE
ncbi:hypothetical protein G9F72_001215 [Clostridium estertheticum]|uniref:restriction endonuclease-related protein n=1 Tax=Clostridium estertheticum TaxID=238834 RepID=UPI0013E98996|nr:hypothetical protein [Clostridium estertheticum]MBZ9684979.1 hypothetical protein [Clostridium estertheticum]